MAWNGQQSTSEVVASTGLQNALLTAGYVPQTGYDEKVALMDAAQNAITAVPPSISKSITPTALASGPSIATQTYTGFTGLLVGDRILVTPPGALTAATAIGGAYCATAGSLAIVWIASTGTPTPTAGTYIVTIFRN